LDLGHWVWEPENACLGERIQEGHRGDLSRSRFINAKQSESKAKVHPPGERVDRLKKEHYSGGSKTSSFYWGLWTWSVLENWVNLLLTSRN
jgi:hypothetical protein